MRRDRWFKFLYVTKLCRYTPMSYNSNLILWLPDIIPKQLWLSAGGRNHKNLGSNPFMVSSGCGFELLASILAQYKPTYEVEPWYWSRTRVAPHSKDRISVSYNKTFQSWSREQHSCSKKMLSTLTYQSCTIVRDPLSQHSNQVPWQWPWHLSKLSR